MNGVLATESTSQDFLSNRQWQHNMRHQFPLKICEPNSYYRQCFTISESECQAFALTLTNACLKALKDKIPENVHLKDDGIALGGLVGACFGDLYESYMAHKKLSLDACQTKALPAKDKDDG